MKNLIKILVLSMTLALGFSGHAQSGSSYTFPRIAGDSLATADTVFKQIVATAGYNQLGIQASIKKGTGTLDGKLYVYSSINSNNFVLTDSVSFIAVPSFATLAGLGGGPINANGVYTHTAYLSKTAPAGTRYLIAVTQTGSLTASPVSVSYTLRRQAISQ